MDSQNGSQGNLGDIERLLASLPNAQWESQMSLDNADRVLLQRLLRLTNALQNQDVGWTTRSSTSSPLPGNATLQSQISDVSAASPEIHCPAPVESTLIEGTNGQEQFDVNDSWDYNLDARSSKTGTPSSDGGDNVSSQARPHAAVEKRYRRTVNTKLQQLHSSIPASGRFTVNGDRDGEGSGYNDSEQAAKPVVLDKAIQYITHLISTYRGYESDIEQLRRQVRDLVDGEGTDPSGSIQSPGTHCEDHPAIN